MTDRDEYTRQATDNAACPAARPLVRGCVARLPDGQLRWLKSDAWLAQAIELGATFHTATPHENDDYSYMCGSEWCRCCD